MPYKGIVDASRLKKWLEPKQIADGNLSDSEGNEYEDYEFLEDEFLQDKV